MSVPAKPKPEREFYGEVDRLLYAMWKGGYSPKEAADLFRRIEIAPDVQATRGAEAS
jgi:hypothetical protein